MCQSEWLCISYYCYWAFTSNGEVSFCCVPLLDTEIIFRKGNPVSTIISYVFLENTFFQIPILEKYFSDVSAFLTLRKEPVGSKAPALDADAKLSLLVRRTGTGISLPCNAQAHPIPITRYLICSQCQKLGAWNLDRSWNKSRMFYTIFACILLSFNGLSLKISFKLHSVRELRGEMVIRLYLNLFGLG